MFFTVLGIGNSLENRAKIFTDRCDAAYNTLLLQFFGVHADPGWRKMAASLKPLCLAVYTILAMYRGPHGPRISTCVSIFFTTG